MQVKFVCKSCGKEFFRSGNAAAVCRLTFRQKGFVYCSKGCASFKHGGHKNQLSEYKSWLAMRNRCDNPNHDSYLRYGGRGITYDPAWNDFSVFLEDMGKKPTSEHQLERVDNNKNYSKENCIWATRKEQTRNRGGKRATRLYTHDGKTMCIKDWAEYVGISSTSMQKRLNNKWPLEKAFSKEKHDKPDLYTFEGKSMSLLEWSKYLGINKNTLYSRIKNNLPPEKIFSSEKRSRWNP